MKSAAIIDLDNCVSDDRWRLPFIQLEKERPNDRYWTYHSYCDSDQPGNAHVIRELSERYDELLVFTSRPETVREKTMSWLSANSIPHALLFMRPDDNHLPSVEMKRLMLSWLPGEYRIEHAIDDRHDILDMYRAEGIPSTRRVFIYEPELVHP
jgi:hypothetical protein